MRQSARKFSAYVLGLALLAPVPAVAAPPVMLAQFFENFDEAPATPPSEEGAPALNPEFDSGFEGLDLDGLEGGEAAAGAPGMTPGMGPGEQVFAGAVPPEFDPAERPKLLEGLYERLAEAKSPTDAAPIIEAIEQLWAMSGSDTVDLLMSRATQFANDSDVDLSLAVLDAVVDIAPDDAEAWYLRAKVNVLAGKPERALADLRRALNLDEKHYRAITDLGLVLEQLGAKKEALKAYRQALAVNPFMDDAQAGVDALSREVEGQDI